MTVHMVRVECAKPGGVTEQQIQQAVDGWLEGRERVLEVQEKQVQVSEAVEQRFEYVAAEFRFALTQNRAALLAGIENTLQGLVNWYVVAYHGCNHDDGGTCQWNERREFGTIPDEVNL